MSKALGEMLADERDEGYAAGLAEGAKREREAVVAWLRIHPVQPRRGDAKTTWTHQARRAREARGGGRWYLHVCVAEVRTVRVLPRQRGGGGGVSDCCHAEHFATECRYCKACSAERAAAKAKCEWLAKQGEQLFRSHEILRAENARLLREAERAMDNANLLAGENARLRAVVAAVGTPESDNGYLRCRVCRRQWYEGDPERHKGGCPFGELP